MLLSLLTDAGEVRSFDLHGLGKLEILDPALRRDLDYYLRTQLSAKKKDARTFTFFAQGQGRRTIRLSYTLEAPVWKATYRILLNEPEASATGQAQPVANASRSAPPMIQGWAVVDNTQDEDWENVQLSLIAGLPVSFVHDLYTPRYIRRPVVQVKETTGVLPPEVEEGIEALSDDDTILGYRDPALLAPQVAALRKAKVRSHAEIDKRGVARDAVSSTPVQTREAPARRPVRIRDRTPRHNPPQPVGPGPHRAACLRGAAGVALQQGDSRGKPDALRRVQEHHRPDARRRAAHRPRRRQLRRRGDARRRPSPTISG